MNQKARRAPGQGHGSGALPRLHVTPAHWLLPPVILATLGALFYYPSLGYDFQFDDLANITKHFAIRSSGFTALFMSSSRWITYWLNAINYSIDKFNPYYYRLFNVVLHTSTSILLFYFLFLALSGIKRATFFREKAFAISFLTAGLFLLHPVQTQTVSYVIQGRLEGLACFFVVGMALCFLLAARTASRVLSGMLVTLMLSLALLSCGSKEITIVAPFLLLLVDWFFIAQGSWWSLKKRLWIHAMTAFVIFGCYLYFLSPKFFMEALGMQMEAKNNIGNILTENPTDRILPLHYLISEFKVIVHYVWIFVWPFNICVEYDWKLVRSFFAPDCLFPLLLLLSIGFALFRLLRRKPASLVGFGALWFFVALAPRSTIIPSPEFIVDYKTYLGSMGWLLLIATAMVKLWGLLSTYVLNSAQEQTGGRHKEEKTSPLLIARGSSACAAGALLLVLGIATLERNKIWHSPEEFWGNIISNAPGKARAYNNFGVALSEKGQYAEAIPYFRKAISMDQIYPDPCNNLAVAYSAIGKLDAAIDTLKQGIRIQPYYPEAYNNLASFLLQRKDYHQAEKALMYAIQLRPHYGKAKFNLGRGFLEQNLVEKAWECFKACCMESDFDQTVVGFSAYANTSMQLQRYDDAIIAYKRLLEVDPSKHDAVFGLGNACFLAKRFEEAAPIFERLTEIAPNDVRVWNNLGETYCSLGNPSKALEIFTKVKGMAKNTPHTDLRIAYCYDQLGERSKAKEVLQEFIKKNPQAPMPLRQKATEVLAQMEGSSHHTVTA